MGGGGAVYVAAKRNASVLHVPFHELYATFAASHFFIAFDVAAMLTVSHIWWMAGNLGNTTWPIWMLVVCFLAAPFLYNPQAFELSTVQHDFRQWQQWMVGGGWDRWWRASRAPKAAGGFGAAAEEQAWGTQFFRAFKCFFYGFVACVVPAKVRFRVRVRVRVRG